MLRKFTQAQFVQINRSAQSSGLNAAIYQKLNTQNMNRQQQPNIAMIKTNYGRRMFSTETVASTASEAATDSIFKQADYFAQEASQAAADAQDSISSAYNFDGNDTLATLMSIVPKDASNLIAGVSTYGFWEYVAYLDTTFYSMWMTAAEQWGMGMGLGLIVTSLMTKALFTPFIVYSQTIAVKMKLLQPDQEELIANMKRYASSGNREAAKIERQKVKFLRKQHGIYPLISMFNIFQMPVHLVYISMINRLSFNYDLNPAILTDGFLWFRDLSAPDPYGILPLIGGVVSLLNILSTSTTSLTPTMRKIRRYVYVLPLISVPIWMTFPAAFNLYWISSSMIHLIILNLFRNAKFRNYIGIPEYLPGTKLERMNTKQQMEVIKPKVFSHAPPSTKLKAKQAQDQQI